uniref:Uncharacterized protein n=1 Tax=viral metagenome TaxID=1070528 RepID=A0A6C0C654_9ZZZZ
MSNNYHTQLNQQSGILNEIASTLQFDQRPQNFENDTKTRNTGPQFPPPRFDNAEKQRPQYDNPKSWNNYGHIQGTPVNNERVEQPKQDEIQLSDIEQRDPPAAALLPPQEQQQYVPSREKHHSPKMKEKYIPAPEKTVAVPEAPESTSPIKKYAIEYALIPISLVGVFILLVHPTTSAYLEKFIPKMTDLKGFAIRGAILAVIYIVIKIIISQTIQKN